MISHETQVAKSDRTLCLQTNMPLTQFLPHMSSECARLRGDLTFFNKGSVSNSHNVWITVIGIILGVVSVLILAAIAVLYLKDGGRPPMAGTNRSPSGLPRSLGPAGARRSYDLRRVPSDMVTLIPKCSSAIEKRVRFDLCS